VYCGVKRLVPREKPNKRCPNDTAERPRTVTPSIPGKWFSSSRLFLSSRRRAHRRTSPSGRSEFWKLPVCLLRPELRILRACMAQSKPWTPCACRACAPARCRYNNRGDRRLFASAGIARSFAHSLPRKTYTAKLLPLLLAFSSPCKKPEPNQTVPRLRLGGYLSLAV
jgi:hypothetical protein